MLQWIGDDVMCLQEERGETILWKGLRKSEHGGGDLFGRAGTLKECQRTESAAAGRRAQGAKAGLWERAGSIDRPEVA